MKSLPSCKTRRWIGGTVEQADKFRSKFRGPKNKEDAPSKFGGAAKTLGKARSEFLGHLT